MTRVLIFTLLCFISLPNYAATGSTGYIDIKQIRIGGGFTRVTGVTPFNDPSNCSNDGTNKNTDVLIFETTKSYKEIVSTLLAAQASNRPVQFWVGGCENDSGKLYPNATFIYLR